MLRYGRRECPCLMQFLRVSLGDLEAGPCGRCGLCRGDPSIDPGVRDEAVTAARQWIVQRELAIPASTIPKMSSGLTLLDGEVRSPLFVRFMKERNSSAELSGDLLDLLQRRLNSLSRRHRLAAVIAVPSRTWKQREFVADWISRHLSIPAELAALVWERLPAARQGELHNNDQRRENVFGRMTARLATRPTGAILLLDDYYGSGNTLKEAVRALRTAIGKTAEVVPITMARVRWKLGSRGMI